MGIITAHGQVLMNTLMDGDRSHLLLSILFFFHLQPGYLDTHWDFKTHSTSHNQQECFLSLYLPRSRSVSLLLLPAWSCKCYGRCILITVPQSEKGTEQMIVWSPLEILVKVSYTNDNLFLWPFCTFSSTFRIKQDIFDTVSLRIIFDSLLFVLVLILIRIKHNCFF